MTENAYLKSALKILENMAPAFDPTEDSHVYIAGGVAVAWWLWDKRVTYDLDAVFIGKLRPEAKVVTKDGDVSLDVNFNDTLSLVEENYQERATEVAVFEKLHVHMISPVDLVLMKASRASQKDMDDIEALIKKGLVDKDEFLRLAKDAMVIYIGNPRPVTITLEKIEQMFPKKKKEQKCPRHFHP